MTFRWGHPITLALYSTIFDPNPEDHAEVVADQLMVKNVDWLKMLIDEAEQELHLNSQQLSRMHGTCSASESQLRTFLSRLVDILRTRIDFSS